jgi:hypothetical protein
MRYIKKLALNQSSPTNDNLSYLQDGRIVTNSSASLQVPTGTTEERPATLVTGTIRYNTTFGEFEVYNGNLVPPKWEVLRTIRPAKIVSQTLGIGNYVDYIFGPLLYTVSTSTPQNIFVFVDGVHQLPDINYTLITNPPASTATMVTSTASGVTKLYISTLTNIDAGSPDGGWRTVSGTNIQAGTTVTSINSTWNNTFYGWPIEISLPTSNSITTGTVLTFDYLLNTGTYVYFNSPAMAGIVTARLGVDGYWPIT